MAEVRAEVQAVGKVTQVSPLMVKTSTAETACPADKLADVTITLNDPVRLTLRTPARPLIQGVVA